MLPPEQQGYEERNGKMDKELTIKESRTKAGLTQQKMSDKLGIPKRTIEDWEGGRRKPPAWAEKLVKKELERMSEKGGYDKNRFDSDNE